MSEQQEQMQGQEEHQEQQGQEEHQEQQGQEEQEEPDLGCPADYTVASEEQQEADEQYRWQMEQQYQRQRDPDNDEGDLYHFADGVEGDELYQFDEVEGDEGEGSELDEESDHGVPALIKVPQLNSPVFMLLSRLSPVLLLPLSPPAIYFRSRTLLLNVTLRRRMCLDAPTTSVGVPWWHPAVGRPSCAACAMTW
jgi:hypothetical protein